MESEAVNSALKKQLEAMEVVMKSTNETQEQLQTKIQCLTKTVDSINQAVHSLFEKQEQTQTKIDGLRNTVDSTNHLSQAGCETPKDVSTCKITAVTVSSLKYLRKSATSNLGQTTTFRGTVLPPSSESHLYNGLAPHVYIYRVVLAICTG
jgi:chromosome segregation ATPase